MKKEGYNFEAIETKWQKIWEEEKVFEVKEDPQKKKFYCLEMYPYPSGRIHMGHVRNYSIGDVISRFMMMNGYNVLHPMGWDALGLPAENAAIKHGIHPQKWTLDNIATMKAQLQRLGFSYDWSREVNTCLPEYYKWNQWFFLKMLERGLAFRRKSWVNWCPQCRTVLANEQAAGDQCWRCSSPVEQKEMDHWFLKITAYARELLTGHSQLTKWPEHVLLMQRNWIGESEGAIISFPLEKTKQPIEVFTTRLDTIYGATFLLLSPEHPLSRELLSQSPQAEEKQAWLERIISESRQRRRQGETEKEGVDTGQRALNPFTGELIPVWIANYVLMDYGTGAIMAVPAHDQRDFEFAQQYGLPVKVVVVPEDGSAIPDPLVSALEIYGKLVSSGPFTGLSSKEAMEAMARYAEEKNIGTKSTIYRLRDWGISRQRYWGTPIPVVYCDRCGIVGVPYEELPVVLPAEVKFTGVEGSPLAQAADFVKTQCPRCHGPARRETDTMDTFFDSSWYFFRYASPQETNLPFRPEKASYWMPVDLYIGGVEHAILHLIYSRFFTKVIRDIGLTDVDEPFPHYLAQGMVTKDGAAMSKSRGNIVDPDDMIGRYGADSLRLFILFAAPPEKEFAWAEEGIEGCSRFLHRVWSTFEENGDLFQEVGAAINPNQIQDSLAVKLLRRVHKTIKRVTEDIGQRFHLNTAISSLMELHNEIRRLRDELRQREEGRQVLRFSLEQFILLLSPFTPHLCEELWQRTGHTTYLIRTAWPVYDPELAQEEMITVVVQVNGKLRDRFEAPADISPEEMKTRALASERIKSLIAGKEVKRIITVENRLVNIVL